VTQQRLGHIRIAQMRFWGKHGVHVKERERPQAIEVDLDVTADLDRPAASDRLEDTIDYAALWSTCRQVVSEESYALLEALARRIAERVCADTRVVEVVVRLRKPALFDGASPEIELHHRPRA
jgi:dihydroneopterin aldolase